MIGYIETKLMNGRKFAVQISNVVHVTDSSDSVRGKSKIQLKDGSVIEVDDAYSCIMQKINNNLS